MGAAAPLTFASRDVIVAAGLAPAYEVAGDSVDYAVDENMAGFAVFDGIGHGLQTAQLGARAVAAYRNARRAAKGLTETARERSTRPSAAFTRTRLS